MVQANTDQESPNPGPSRSDSALPQTRNRDLSPSRAMMLAEISRTWRDWGGRNELASETRLSELERDGVK
jgi:hypothetical protein